MKKLLFDRKWKQHAREEGRICRICHEPISKADWKDKILDRLCILCFMREAELPHSPGFRLGHDIG